MSKLKNKVAIITGASKGIGAGIAKAYGAEGASVVVNYSSDKEGADRVVNDITANGGKALAAMDGRFSVAIDDIKRIAILPECLRYKTIIDRIMERRIDHTVKT